MGLVIGTDNFGKVIKRKLDFVDKSLLIKDVIDDSSEVLLITRPRRFGKTLNLSMLHHFLASNVYGMETKGLFDGLKISELGEDYMQHQGKYPVIFITFKDIKDGDINTAYDRLNELIIKTFNEYSYLEKSDKLSPNLKSLYQTILYRKASRAQLEDSLQTLTACLYEHHGVKPWILIDEYDTPIQSSHLHGFYEEMINVIRGMFSAALKTNQYLNKAVITGILRIAKESLFSGLNNLKVYSILSSTYGQYFGFTEDELLGLLKQSKMEDKFEEFKEWYNGYNIGDVNVYNPWSIVNSIEDKKFRPYWVNTGDTTLIKNSIAISGADTKQKFESMLQGEPIEAFVNESIVYGDLYDEKKNSLWSLLLFSGYLKASNIVEDEELEVKCLLRSPNKEVTALYRSIIKRWFTDNIGQDQYVQFLNSLTEGRMDEFHEMLTNFLLESSSVFDVKGKNPEKFYHGFVLGMIVSLKETHIIKSNRESGYGRYDVMIIPKDKSKLGLILEFKVAKNKLSLEKEAKNALDQIEERKYEAEMKQLGINNILKLGLAFRGKKVFIMQQ